MELSKSKVISWDQQIVLDDLWGESEKPVSTTGQWLINSNFRTCFSSSPSLDGASASAMPIHPAYLDPAIILTVDRDGCVQFIELLNGELTGRKDYSLAISVIEESVKSASGPPQTVRNLWWWRVYAMFDRVFFLALSAPFSKVLSAKRRPIGMPVDNTPGEIVGLYDQTEMIGVDGWFHQATGFGINAKV